MRVYKSDFTILRVMILLYSQGKILIWQRAKEKFYIQFTCYPAPVLQDQIILNT